MPALSASRPQTHDMNTNTTCSSGCEHPEWIAERLIRFAKLVGRENVMARADCGFSSQALYKTEVHPTVVREKFKHSAGSQLGYKTGTDHRNVS